jgi:hypothetical protein
LTPKTNNQNIERNGHQNEPEGRSLRLLWLLQDVENDLLELSEEMVAKGK